MPLQCVGAPAHLRLTKLTRIRCIVVEAKITRPGRADKQIGTELLLDVARYAAHPTCEHLICFVYDPGNHIVNPAALQNDLARHAGRLRVDVIVSPVQ